ncbi:MAG: hydrogenase small subunit [Actinomycetota bacterium]|nr:hydrogenase small subunit [Actinomycetota bacterium]
MRDIFKSLSRREFLKYSASLATLLGLSELYVPQIASAIEGAKAKPALLWLNGASCTGDTVSLVNSDQPTPAEIVLDILSVRYMETVMAGQGDVAEKAFEDTVAGGGYVFALEGSVSTGAGGMYNTIKGKPVMDMIKRAAANSIANIAVGTCASYGGVPAGDPNPTECKGLQEVVGGTVVNIPGCPAHPDWIVGTVTHLLLFGKPPELDAQGRPKLFYGKLIHDNCQRRNAYERGEWLKEFGQDETDMLHCMAGKGCRGPITHSDCPIRLWNSGTNYCIGASAPCAGCVEPDFPDFKDKDGNIISLYSPVMETLAFKERLDAAAEPEGSSSGAVLGAVAGVAAGAVGGYLAGKKTKEGDE